MRLLAIAFIIVGIVALAVPTITITTTERAVDAGFFSIDVKKPHTIFLNPYVGFAAVAGGIAMLFASRRTNEA